MCSPGKRSQSEGPEVSGTEGQGLEPRWLGPAPLCVVSTGRGSCFCEPGASPALGKAKPLELCSGTGAWAWTVFLLLSPHCP